jgi:hypothetical protein
VSGLFLIGENEVIYEIFPDRGHDISIVQTERFNRRVARFLTPDDEEG